MKSSKNIVILGAGELQKPLIQASKKRNWNTIVFDKSPTSPGKNLADTFIQESIYNKQKIYQCLKELSITIDFCCTAGTDASQTVAHINQNFNLLGVTPNQAEVSTHKGKMRDFLSTLNIAQPKYSYSENKKDIINFIRLFPKNTLFVLKPVQNMGSRGVMLIQNPTQISYAFEISQNYSPTQEVIIEEYVHGNEISIDSLAFNDQVYITGIADRHITIQQEHYFIETGHSMPSSKYLSKEKDIQQLIQKISNGMTSMEKVSYAGAIKGDLKITPNGKIIVAEFATRLSGGFMSSHTYPWSTNHDLVAEYLNLLENNPSNQLLKRTYHNYTKSAIERSIHVTDSGQITNLSFPEKESFLDIQYPVNIISNYCEGDLIYPLTNNVGKLMHIIAVESNLNKAEQKITNIKKEIKYSITKPQISYRQITKEAKRRFSQSICWGCKICDGKNCASSVPGMGAVGNMHTFYANYQKLQEIEILPRFIVEENSPPFELKSSTVSFFNTLGSLPIFSAPITGSKTNLGGAITEWEYATSVGETLSQMNLFPTFGDGATEDKFLIGLHAIKKIKRGFPVFKPRDDIGLLKERIEIANEFGVKAWGMDVDGVWFKTMMAKQQKSSHKSIDQLQILANHSPLPFFLKGILSIEDAEKACISGASAIVVSNHGGRVLDFSPATCTVLPQISKFVREKYPKVKILVDGGIRSGYDIFKMLALGADGVMIGRPLAISAVAYKEIGVYSLLELYINEFIEILHKLNISKLENISYQFLRD